MLKRISCDKPSFKTVEFKKGFNVILADKTLTSTDKDSRNGLGKSTLLKIIHFCLGSNVKPSSVFRSEHLNDWTFTLELNISGKDYKIHRNTANNSKIYLEGDFSEWIIKPEKDSSGKFVLSNANWRVVLGKLLFGLSPNEKKYKPSFRSMISYFIRKDAKAYTDSFKNSPQQKEWDIQVNNAYMLGLNWEYASEFQILKDNENSLKELKKAAKAGLLDGCIGTIGQLESEKLYLEDKITETENDLKNFKVHPKYGEIELNVNKNTEKIQDLLNNKILNSKMVIQYKENLEQEKDISTAYLEDIYNEAGLIFPDAVKLTIEEVLSFHENIILNRRKYLSGEIERLSNLISSQEEMIKSLSDEKSRYMEILSSHGALEEYTKINGLLMDDKQKLNDITQRINNLKRFESGISELKIKKEELRTKARLDFEERNSLKNQAVRLFNKFSKYLYQEPGTLSLDLSDTGYKFNIEIKRTDSQGVNYMKVFCYDLVLLQMRNSMVKPDFLVHDSTIFDGVDERQVAKALELASNVSEENNLQYICTMNSDVIPHEEFSGEFKKIFDGSIITRLTDATPEGGLLGIRF
ncbi:ABC-three component system protein [Methanococcus maripaludis]|uniref:Uncharacterized protein YydD (DUF2326 family) n=1 Tax=Methanococcus maripaludis TaxID=39152 RepID=A0A8T4CJR6_METMI|nr:DUF2326 domain-containing protein [Methanococcus maripaludis]MBM7408761.1 uncharacterized protein YydD (DUF2326 family) [Methanococcus maripaludis]MBP2219070.1 uncharacterized protein YydD (DUF2326 family) [Methanococcus maripaludis]